MEDMREEIRGCASTEEKPRQGLVGLKNTKESTMAGVKWWSREVRSEKIMGTEDRKIGLVAILRLVKVLVGKRLRKPPGASK